MSFSPTKDQQNAINAKGAVLLSAAAGSGKTATLIERVYKLITDEQNPIDINEILVVTFTKSAANEMRSRIAKRLSDEHKKDPSNRRILRQQMLLPVADFCTIDSFCKKTATEYFELLDIPCNIRYANEEQIKLIYSKAKTNTLEYFLNNHHSKTVNLAKAVGDELGLTALAESIISIYKFSRSLPSPFSWYNYARDMYKAESIEKTPWLKYMITDLCVKANHAIELLDYAVKLACESEELEKRYNQLLDFSNFSKSLLKAINDSWDDTSNLLKHTPEYKWTSSCKASVPKEHQTVFSLARDKAFDFFNGVKELFINSKSALDINMKIMSDNVNLLIEMVKYFYNEVNQIKKAQELFDFADVEYLVLDLIQSDTYASKEIKNKYKEVMVDEYQDVNDLQNMMFFHLSQNGKNLFCVGDVKQSIYRFREANPDNFLRMLNEYKPFTKDNTIYPATIMMSGNFRSRKGICSAVNYIFSRIMHNSVGDIDYTEEHYLEANGCFPERNDTPDFSVVMLQTDKENSSIKMESDFIASKINDMMSVECISDGNTLRKARLSDFAILYRSSTHVEEYQNALKEHGINCSIDRKQNLMDDGCVQQLFSYLKIVNNPHDDTALITCMMSPMFGFTADELAKIRLLSAGSIYSCVLKDAQNNTKSRHFVEQTEKLRRLSVINSPDEVVNCAITQTGFLYSCTLSEATSSKENLLIFLDKAREFSAYNSGGFSVFINHFQKIADDGNIPVVANNKKVEDNCVKMMTIHHSKGLQFPVCFIIKTHDKIIRNDNSNLLIDRDLGIGMNFVDHTMRIRKSTIMKDAIRLRKTHKEFAEELRAYYVAMTRAIDNCFVLSSFSNISKTEAVAKAVLSDCLSDKNTKINSQTLFNANSIGTLLLYVSHIAKNNLQCNTLPFEISKVYSIEDVELDTEEETKSNDILPLDENLYINLCERLSFDNPNKLLKGIASKRSVSELTHNFTNSRFAFSARPSFLKNEGLTAKEKGTALHRFMQFADFAHAQKDINDELDRLVDDRFISKIQRDNIDILKLKKFFESDLYQRINRSKKVMREERFIIEMSAKTVAPELPDSFNDEKIVVQGITDCLFFENDEIVILDYKTDRVENMDQLIDLYAPQLEIYSKAFSRSMKKRVKSKIIYSFWLDCYVEL